MATPYVTVGIDIGTSSVKAVAADDEHLPLTQALSKHEDSSLRTHLAAWLKTRKPTDRAVWQSFDYRELKSTGGAELKQTEGGVIVASGKNPDFDTYTITGQTMLPTISAIRLETLPDTMLPKGGPGRAANGNFALSDVKVFVSNVEGKETKPVEIVSAIADYEQKGLPASATIDSDAKSSWAVDGQIGKPHSIIFRLKEPISAMDGRNLTVTLKFNNNNGHNIGRFRLSLTGISDAGLFANSSPERVEQILAALDSGKTSTDKDLPFLLPYYKTIDSEWKRLNQAVEEHEKNAPQPKMATMMICSEGVTAIRTHTQGGDFLPETHILSRGDPNLKQSAATQSFLQVLVRTPEGDKKWLRSPPPGVKTSYRRTGLAAWITDVDNGAGALLARVIVNRLWQHHFGVGIVSTPSDFGTQGARPTNPELLEWLASELIRNNWQIKPIQKLIMSSSVYMQTTANREAEAKVDPTNKLLWRQNRRRLEAEAIRDSMLSVSGTLDETMFGTGTLDESMKRRSIYFFVKRSKLIPTMMLFDAPNALQSMGLRATTTVAPQALMLMNNPQVRLWSQGFAVKAEAIGGGNAEQLVKSCYTLAIGRTPDAQELLASTGFLKSQTESYRAANSKEPAHAALVDLCQALFGLNEFIYIN